MVATRIGEVRRVVAAAPRYLAQHPRIEAPADLAKHQIIAMTQFGQLLEFSAFAGLLRAANGPVYAAAGDQ